MQGENPYQIESRSRSDAEAAFRELQAWMRPLPEARMFGALGELYIRTARRGEGETDKEALFRIYARDLAAYPGDVTLSAITGYRGTFFPALGELQEIIERDSRIRERRLRLEAFRAFLTGEPEKPKGPPPTAEQIERNAQWAREMSGNKPAPISQEKLDRLAEVDRVHGDAAKAKGGNWKSLAHLAEREGR